MKGRLIHESEEVSYFGVVEKTATKAAGGRGAISGKVYLPKEWVGKRVLCLLLDEPESIEEKKD